MNQVQVCVTAGTKNIVSNINNFECCYYI